MPLTNEAYIEQLETEKAELLTQLENYAKEQAAKVIIFNDREKLIVEKDKQLAAQEQQLEESDEQITKLKTRIHQLAKAKKAYATTVESDNSNSEETIKPAKSNATTQTDGLSPQELEEQLLEKRLTNLKDFGTYREQLQAQDHLISLYQKKLQSLRKQAKSPLLEKYPVTILLLTMLFSILLLK